MEQIRIGFIGDSITHGTGDDTLLGWTVRLGQAERPRGYDVVVYNLGVRADTSELIAPRWEAECEARLQPAFRCATVFAVGINDSAHEKSPDRDGRRVALDQSAIAITAMIKSAARFGPSLWVGPTPVVEAMMPLSPYDGLSYNFENAAIAPYSQAYAARAAELGIDYVDLYGALSVDPAWETCLKESDGLHPNARGYEMMAELIGSSPAWRGMLDHAS